MTFAEQLKSERERLGLTQAACAALFEVSKSAVEKWEAGKVPLKPMRVGALAILATIKPR